MFSSAIRSNRRGERGVSLIEALIMLAIVAIATALLMPVLGQSVRRTFGISDAATERLDQAIADSKLRTIFLSASRGVAGESAQVSGTDRRITVYTEGGIDHPCAETNGVVDMVVRQTSRGALLICATGADGRGHALLSAQGWSLALSYSVDGVAWLSSWPSVQSRGDDADPEFVRLLWQAPGKVRAAVFQLGAAGPNPRDAASDQPARTFP